MKKKVVNGINSNSTNEYMHRFNKAEKALNLVNHNDFEMHHVERLLEESKALELKNDCLQKELTRMKGKFWTAIAEKELLKKAYRECWNTCQEALMHLCGNGTQEAELHMIKKLQDTLEKNQ